MHLARTDGAEVSVGAVSLASRNEKGTQGRKSSELHLWLGHGGRASSGPRGRPRSGRPAGSARGPAPRPGRAAASLRASELGGAGRCRVGGAGRGGNKAKAQTLPC